MLAILDAWLSGSLFIGNQSNGHSLAMALGTALALLCYTLVVFLVKPSAAAVEGRDSEDELMACEMH